MDNDRHFVDSFGTTWANETEHLRLKFPDDFEVESNVINSTRYSKAFRRLVQRCTMIER